MYECTIKSTNDALLFQIDLTFR